MKKSILLLTGCMLVSLTACGQENTAETTANTSTNSSTTQEEPAKEPEQVTEIGQGTFYLENESGTTENGDPITIYEDGETQLLQIGLNTTGFDGGKLTYVYVDGELLTKEQYGEETQETLELGEKQLAPGTHQVVLKQYENDDEKTDPITVKVATYEVKAK